MVKLVRRDTDIARPSAALLATLLLSGCAGAALSALAPRSFEVKIPVPVTVPCRIPKLTRPALPIAALKADSPPADTMRAYAATVITLKGAVSERDDLLAGCGWNDAGRGSGK